MAIVTKRFPGSENKPYYECTSVERSALAGVPNEPILWHETDTGSWYIPNGIAWEGPYTAAQVGLGGGDGSGSLAGALSGREFAVAAAAPAATLYTLDFGSNDPIRAALLRIVRTGGTAPAVPTLCYFIARTQAAGAAVLADFNPPTDGTGVTEAIPLLADDLNSSRSARITLNGRFRYITVKFDQVTGATHRIFGTGAA